MTDNGDLFFTEVIELPLTTDAEGVGSTLLKEVALDPPSCTLLASLWSPKKFSAREERIFQYT